MLTILHDPAGITGRHRFAWDLSATLQENIERHITSGADCQLTLNGCQIDPLTDPRMDQPPTALDIALLVRRPRGFDPFSWTAIAIYAAIGAAALTYALMPKLPGANVGKDSPNNSLTGQSNVARAYQAIPDVYGYRRVWPDLIQPSTVEYIDQVKYVTEWLCVSRGKGTISDVKYAETPIIDIDGASFEVFEPVPVDGYPELGEVTLADVLETFASDEVNGQELLPPTSAASVSQSGSFASTSGSATFTVTLVDGSNLAALKALAPSGTARVSFTYGASPTAFDSVCTVASYAVASGRCTFTLTAPSPWASTEAGSLIAFTLTPTTTGTPTAVGPFTLPVQCDRIRWNTVFLRGLKGSVIVRANWWQVDGAGATIPGTSETHDYTFTADKLDQRFYTTDVTPTAGYGRYRIQFLRLTPTLGGEGADVAKLEEVYAVRHHAEKVLPGVTVIRVTTKATQEATGFSDRKFNLRWLRHVRELDAETLSESRNFARSMVHIWTLAGNDIAGIDVDALAAVNDEFGEDSPLLRCDCSLDDADASLGERLQAVANTARCLVWRDGLRWTVTRDQARPYPELQLDYRNLAAGGESAISFAAHLPASNDGVEVEYVDEETQSKKAYVRLSIVTGSPLVAPCKNPKKVKLPGCTTFAQAHNRAQLEARRLLYQRVSVADTALQDGATLGLGSLVRWIDPNDFAGDDGLQAGEVMSIDGSVITTSEPLDWKGQTSGRMLFTGADGKHLSAPVPCYPVGAAVRLASVPAGLFVAGADRQLGSRYAFAVGLTEAEMEAAGLFIATELRPAADGTVSLGLAQYDDRIYEADA